MKGSLKGKSRGRVVVPRFPRPPLRWLRLRQDLFLTPNKKLEDSNHGGDRNRDSKGLRTKDTNI